MDPFTLYTENTGGTVGVASNQCTVTHGAGTYNDIVTETSSSFTMPQVFVSIDVDQTGTGSSGYDCAGVGIVKDQNNYLLAVFDRVNNVVRLQVKVAGVNTNLGSISYTIPAAPYTMGLSLVANSACLWIYTGGAWVYKTGADVSSYYDFRTTGNLTSFKAGFIVASSAATSWKFSDFKCGRFGGVGFRDATVVTDEDGNPDITDTTALITATLPDPRGVAYFGILELDLSSDTLTQVGALMVSRDGKTYNDLDGHIIKYATNRKLTISTWGNGFGGDIAILYKEFTSGDILSGANVVSGMTELNLPGLSTGYGAYSPMMIYRDSKWWICYDRTTDTTFATGHCYAALAYSTDLSSWTLQGADMAHTDYEGTRFLVANNSLWVLTSTLDSIIFYD